MASPISSDVGNFDVIRAAYSNDPVSYVAADTFGWWMGGGKGDSGRGCEGVEEAGGR